ncbi:MAG: lipid-A-disaccharide synthase [Bacteroidota bacterium]|nr:lipid-A-disaccharide synthase [Bacteroidota bacterium]
MSSGPPVIMLIAGEASGDQYGARVIRAFRRRHPDAVFFGIGGDLMQAEGMELLYHIRDTAIMGFVEVVRHYPFLKEMFRSCQDAYRDRGARAAVLIDYPGFNLRLAEKVKEMGGRVLYYISPQVWAWGSHRAKKMKKLVDHLAVVFPFEEEIFTAHDIPTTFVGHPLLEILEHSDRREFLRSWQLPEDRPLLALLPGSRKQEIQRLLPAMLEAAAALREKTGCSVAVGAARQPDALYEKWMQAYPDIPLLRDATHALMQHAYAAVVASGTATVETAYYETPMVIVYRASTLNYQIGRHLVQVPNIGMANILAGKRIVPELLQSDVTPYYITSYTLHYFTDTAQYENTRQELRRVKEMMGTPGASERVAAILDELM